LRKGEGLNLLTLNYYPKKIWTKFESDQFKSRFGQNAIIPIWYSDTIAGYFDETKKYGGITFYVDKEFESQVLNIVENLSNKLQEQRRNLS
jgi:hypothetical protein